MIPLYIYSMVLPPGTELKRNDDELPSEILRETWSDFTHAINDAMVVWSVECGVIVTEGDERVDDKFRLTETLFLVTSIIELTPHPWLVEFMSEESYESVANYVEELYEITLSYLGALLTVPADTSFLTLWSVSTSFDWESQINEVDSIDLRGEAQVALRKTEQT